MLHHTTKNSSKILLVHREHIARQLQSHLSAKLGDWPTSGTSAHTTWGALTPRSLTPRTDKLPLVYHPRYNISFFGIEKLHPFDAQKFGRVAQGLEDARLLHKDQVRPHSTPRLHTSAQLLRPGLADDDLMLTVHTQEYLNTLNTNRLAVARVLELPPLVLLPMALILDTLQRRHRCPRG